jgi:putative phage-type endonuclease
MTLTVKQLAERRTGVGASDVAAALGLSPFCTPLKLYQQKRGEIEPDEENLPMRYGNHVEPFVLREFALKHPQFEIVASPDTMRHANGVMLAHLDAWMPKKANVQVKTARTREGWGDSGSADVPLSYLLQVQAEMMVANLPVSWVPTLFGGADYDEFVVEADRELQEMIEAGVMGFWQRVKDGEPPEPVTVDDAIERWGSKSTAAKVVATDVVVNAITNLKQAKAAVNQAQEDEDGFKVIVLKALGESDTLVDVDGKVLATWRATAAPRRFDLESFKAEHANLHAQFLKEGQPSRRLLLK